MNKQGGARKTTVAIAAMTCLAGLVLPMPAAASVDESRSVAYAIEAAPDGSDSWLDTADRQAVIDSYTIEFSAVIPDIQWTGNHANCDVGTTSDAYRAATVDRVNWFRSAAGLPPVTENAAYSVAAQQAVLTTALSPEGGLSHEPPSSYACFTQAAYDGSLTSNLYKGRTGPDAIDGYMTDWGTGNESVGHRNWLLNPTSTEFGVGGAPTPPDGGYSANVLMVREPDAVLNAPNPDLREPDGFVAWPNRGYVPADVVVPRWSFSLHNADFSEARVQTQLIVEGVTSDVSSQTIFDDSIPGAAPQEIIVWEPDLAFSDSPSESRVTMVTPAADETYRVTVDNVIVDGAARSFTYDVTVIGDHFAPLPERFVLPAAEPEPEPVIREQAAINAVDRDQLLPPRTAEEQAASPARAFAVGARVASVVQARMQG